MPEPTGVAAAALAMMDDRFMTMSLGSKGPATIPNHPRKPRECVTNRVDDIEGAQSELKYLRYTSRRPNFYVTDDIDGSHPMKLHPRGVGGVDRLAETDIEGSKPRPLHFKTERHVARPRRLRPCNKRADGRRGVRISSPQRVSELWGSQLATLPM